jgi:RNA polymerase sigma factor (sigma-70 family)
LRHPGDSELIERCLRGEQAAWDELVDRYGRLVYSVPRRYGLSEADAADVMQNVFVTAFRKLEMLKDHDRLSSWLITTSHRESWRVGKRSSQADHLDEHVTDLGTPGDERIDAWERQHLVRAGLARLDARCRDLLTALFLEPSESSYEQIARRLEMRIGSIGPTRARCFKKLEAILADLGFEGE